MPADHAAKWQACRVSKCCRSPKGFGGRAAIEDVSFSVSEREFVAVLGPSGAGKTTLFRCVTGLLAPDRGKVRVAGLDVSTLRGRERRHIGVVFQQFNLVSRLSAFTADFNREAANRLYGAPAARAGLES